HDDPWVSQLDHIKTGEVFEDCVVASVSEHGVFVSVQPGIDGFIPNGEIPEARKPNRGDKVKAEISNIDSMDRRISMSLRQVGESAVAEHVKGSGREGSGQSGTLGDLLKQKFGDKLTSMAQPDGAGASSDAETEG